MIVSQRSFLSPGTAAQVLPSSGSRESPSISQRLTPFRAFTFVYTDGNGSGDINTLYALFNTVNTGTANACSVTYTVANNELTLANDAGTSDVGFFKDYRLKPVESFATESRVAAEAT